jgi:hypothetical protein
MAGLRIQSVLKDVLSKETRGNPKMWWLNVGVTFWVRQQLLIMIYKPETAKRYQIGLDQSLEDELKAPHVLNMEKDPKDSEDHQVFLAYAIFRTIAEKHGNEAVTKLLAAFWKLPVEKRTSEAFKKIVQKQLEQPLSAFLPRGVVAEPVAAAAKSTK